ncbi:MAG: hypothetical protein OEZ13_03850 [Spirochaetia bacterium]|nr:hypothetical protein [Spirochaetia bacterium]
MKSQYLKTDIEIVEIEMNKVDNNDLLCVVSNKGFFEEEKKWPFYQGMPKVLDKLNITNKNVLLDITGLQVNIIYYLIKLMITKYTPQLLFSCYIEPDEYTKLEADQYLLNEEVFGLKAIPGFAKYKEEADKKILIAFLGFEGERLLKIIEEQHSDAIVYPVISFPAYKSYWNYIALKKNYEALNNVDFYKDIAYYDARDPIDTMNVINTIYNKNHRKTVLITSLGTKPTILGVALSASHNKHIHPISDYPLESEKKSSGIGRISIYPISKYTL